MLQESISQFRLLFRSPSQRFKFPIKRMNQSIVVIGPNMDVSLRYRVWFNLNLPNPCSEEL